VKKGKCLNHLNHELQTILKLIKNAGEIIEKIRSRSFEIKYKSHDSGPVTEADLAASEYLIKEISHHFPNDLVISEEAPLPEDPSEGKRTWFIDPIDGTKEFIKMTHEWSIMIGLAVHQRPVLGVVYQPHQEKLYFATKNGGAFLEYKGKTRKLKVNPPQELKSAKIIQSRSHYDKKIEAIAKNVGISEVLRLGSIGLKLGFISEGGADLYFNLSGKCHLWDLCGPEIILEESGGVVMSEDDLPIIYHPKTSLIKNKFIASSNKIFTESLIKLL
jgi:3'(2'), 5'-bisphosphate nucleotidase